MYKLLTSVLLATALIVACTPSETVCSTLDTLKLTFDEFALDGEFSANTIIIVNQVTKDGKAYCEAPAGTYTQAKVIAVAANAVLVLRRALRESDVAYQVMKPQLDQLEGLLKEARK